jgi:hypothetical protein
MATAASLKRSRCVDRWSFFGALPEEQYDARQAVALMQIRADATDRLRLNATLANLPPQ